MLRPIRELLGMGCAEDSGRGGADFCSGRGECHNGTCLCEIRYSGDECAGPNLPYHAGNNYWIKYRTNEDKIK